MSATIIDLSGRREFSAAGRANNSAESAESAAMCELRRARLRIAQLERNLTTAMRDSLMNYKRAREVERLLADFEAESG